MANTNRFSTYTTFSTGSDAKNGEPKKSMWSSMLNSVASGKHLPEKNLLVLGGTVDTQRDFIESLSNIEARRTFDHAVGSKIPPVANMFALGYSYYDVLDTDQEDTLARISLYTLHSPSQFFAPLIQPLITSQSIPNTLIVILLDWSHPWRWMRQLREWILLLRTVLLAANEECVETMEEVMMSWRDRGRGGGTNLDGTSSAAMVEDDIALPLGPGEWEDAIGLPLCVVCQNAEKMEILERTQGWKEEEFDTVLQYMRTVLLKHGASLIYTSSTTPSQLPSLIHASLGIQSLLKKQVLKHNLIDRDKIFVPPNWDSWGKIRVLRDGFDVEEAALGWSNDLSLPHDTDTNGDTARKDAPPELSTVAMYEATVRDLSLDALRLASEDAFSTTLEVETQDTQVFLQHQLEVLESHRQKSEQDKLERVGSAARPRSNRMADGDDNRVTEHIGPVQFNMGGIQVDAEDMSQRHRDRQTYGSSPEPASPKAAGTMLEETPQMDTANLQAFFTGLMNRKGVGSGAGAAAGGGGGGSDKTSR